jgi:hypothetical protein
MRNLIACQVVAALLAPSVASAKVVSKTITYKPHVGRDELAGFEVLAEIFG